MMVFEKRFVRPDTLRKILPFLLVSLLLSNISGQDCSILSKANNITPDRLCSPVTAIWTVSYTGVNNAGTPVNIRFDWNNGITEIVPATQISPGVFEATSATTYTSSGNKCNYHPQATLMVNGVLCTSSVQEQIVTVWDDDDHNGGRMRISPVIYPICYGNSANVRFRDLTQFNCVPPQERDNPNVNTRWIQWIYGTDITMKGKPVTIEGKHRKYPYVDDVITLTGPVTGSGVWSDVINVSDDKDIGEYFQVTLRNWNYCNPYDDPLIPGPPADKENGDHPPVVTTAIILIVGYPDATITPVDTLCANASPVTLAAHDPGGTWSGSGVTGNIFDPAVAGPGDHPVKYVITNAEGCSDSDEIIITVMPVPDATITSGGIVCFTDPAFELMAHDSGGIWAGPGVVGNMFDPSVAGAGNHTITYTISDASGCSDSDQTIITVATPDATITPVDTLCVNDAAITLMAHDLGGVWSGPGVVGNTFVPMLAGIGDHLIRYNIVNVNCKDNDSTIVTVMPVPEVTLIGVGTAYINDPPVILNASPADGTWSGTGVSGNVFEPNSAGIGTHILTYETIPDAWGCMARDTIHVTVLTPPVPVADFKPDTSGCAPLTVQFNNISLYGEAYFWDFGDKVYSNERNPLHTYYIPGSYDVKLTVFNVTGQSVYQGIIRVYQNPTAIFSAYPTEVVNSIDTVQFINNSVLADTYLWDFGDGTSSFLRSPWHTYDTSGIYNVKLKVTSVDGCVDSSIYKTPIRVVFSPPPVADFEPDTAGCTPLTVQFVNKSLYGESFIWDFGDKSFSNDEDPVHTYFVPGNYIVRLTVFNAAGQSSYQGTVSVYQNPTSIFTVYPIEVIDNNDVVKVSDYSIHAYSYVWDFGDGYTSMDNEPYHKYEADGVYNIKLTVTSEDGCVDSSTYHSPVVVSYKEGYVMFANVFRWNMSGPTGGYWTEGSKDNTVFRPFFKNVAEYSLVIYNRWGDQIYESDDLYKGWDGYFKNNVLAMQGVYVYKATGKYIDGNTFEKVGDVTFLH